MYLPILTYHRLLSGEASKDVDPKRISVSQRQFRVHLRWLKRLGYQTVNLEKYADALKSSGSSGPSPRRRFAITFDDGYEEVLTLALPILQEFGFTATVFAVSEELGGINRWDDGGARLLSRDQYLALHQAGITVGAHTGRHVHLPQVDAETAREEITVSKSRLETALGIPITLFAYPYGESNEAVERQASEAGFLAAFATDRAPADHSLNRYKIRRVVVFPRNNVWEILVKVQRWYPAYQDWKRRP